MGVVVLDLVVFGFFCRWPNLKSGCLSLYAIVSQTNRSHEKPGSLECLNFALHLFISRIIVQTATDRYYSVLLKDLFFRFSKPQKYVLGIIHARKLTLLALAQFRSLVYRSSRAFFLLGHFRASYSKFLFTTKDIHIRFR